VTGLGTHARYHTRNETQLEPARRFRGRCNAVREDCLYWAKPESALCRIRPCKSACNIVL